MADWDEHDLRPGDDGYEGDDYGRDAAGPYREVPEEIDATGPPPASGTESGQLAWAIWAAAVLVVITTSIFVYQRLRSREPEAPLAPSAASPLESGAAAPAPDTETDEPPPPLPPLNESDAAVRALLRALSSHPALAAFFVDEGLVRRGVVIIVNVAEGDDPTRHVRQLVPEEKFAVVRRGARLYVDPESYRRYDGLAAGFAALDVAGTRAFYERVKPLVEEAYRELGYLDEPFEATLARAIGKLQAVPVLEDSIAVYPVSVNYQYEDPSLSKLEPGQKLLLRMGPANVRAIQAKLRELADAFELSPTASGG